MVASSTANVIVFGAVNVPALIVTVSPLASPRVVLPLTAKLFRTVVVPEVAPILIAVPACAKLTVVAVAFSKLNVVAVVVMSPPLTAKSSVIAAL